MQEQLRFQSTSFGCFLSPQSPQANPLEGGLGNGLTAQTASPKLFTLHTGGEGEENGINELPGQHFMGMKTGMTMENWADEEKTRCYLPRKPLMSPNCLLPFDNEY